MPGRIKPPTIKPPKTCATASPRISKISMRRRRLRRRDRRSSSKRSETAKVHRMCSRASPWLDSRGGCCYVSISVLYLETAARGCLTRTAWRLLQCHLHLQGFDHSVERALGCVALLLHLDDLTPQRLPHIFL